MAEARAFGRALDQSRDVGDDEAAVLVGAHDAEVGCEGRERIVGDLGPRGGDRADQRRLAGVGHAQQPHVGEHAQFEAEPARLAFLPGGRLPRRPVGARLEVQVAQAPATALRDLRALAVVGEVGEALAAVGVGHHRAHRHAQHDVLAALAVLVGTAAVLAALRAEQPRVAILDQRVDVAVGDDEDAAAAPAVAAVRAAARDVLLAPERHRAVAAVAGVHLDHRFVDELHGSASGASWGMSILRPSVENEPLVLVAAPAALPRDRVARQRRRAVGQPAVLHEQRRAAPQRAASRRQRSRCPRSSRTRRAAPCRCRDARCTSLPVPRGRCPARPPRRCGAR